MFRLKYRWFILCTLLLLSFTARAAIEIVAGGNQSIAIGMNSSNIIFKVTDEFGSPLTGEMVQFSMLTPMGTPSTQGLSVTLAAVSGTGEVFTRFTESNVSGNYQVYASLVRNPNIFAHTNISVISRTTGANIVISSGASQQVPAGTASENIVYKVADSFGNAITGVNVSFTLINPSGQVVSDGLTVHTMDVDASGQATTQLKAQTAQQLGVYALIAHLTHDSTKSVNTTITVTASEVANINAVSMPEQNITINTESDWVQFRVVDAFDNPVAQQVVQFDLLTPSARPDNNLLTVTQASSDAQGLVSTKLKPTATLGSYQITASLVQDASKLATVRLIVIDSNTGIYVLSGYFNKLVAGNKPEDIRFKVINANGTVAANTGIVFYLYHPTGQLMTDAILNPSALTNNLGEVILQLAALNTAGKYTLVAALASDDRVNITLDLNVVAAPAAQLKVVEGGGQITPAGRSARPIVFELSDSYGNTVTANNLSFTGQNASGHVLANLIEPQQANTDLHGRVTVNFNVNVVPGVYSILGFLTNNNQVRNSTYLTVGEALPSLPSLGFATMVDALGRYSINRSVSVYGGCSVNGGVFLMENAQTSYDNADIQAYINIAPQHVGQIADLLVVVGVTPNPEVAENYYMYNTPQRLDAWSPGRELTAFRTGVTLSDVELLKIFTGNFGGQTGLLRLAVGYRLSNGNIIFNGENLISLIVY